MESITLETPDPWTFSQSVDNLISACSVSSPGRGTFSPSSQTKNVGYFPIDGYAIRASNSSLLSSIVTAESSFADRPIASRTDLASSISNRANNWICAPPAAKNIPPPSSPLHQDRKIPPLPSSDRRVPSLPSSPYTPSVKETP